MNLFFNYWTLGSAISARLILRNLFLCFGEARRALTPLLVAASSKRSSTDVRNAPERLRSQTSHRTQRSKRHCLCSTKFWASETPHDLFKGALAPLATG